MSDPIYIRHFSHSHGYFLSNTSDIQKSIRCEACGDEISTSNGPLYASCDRCMKFMHKICTESPQQIHNHPFHKHHPLTLLVPPSDESDGATCHACGDTIRNFRYRCGSELCDFDLDLKCSTLIHMTSSDVVREHQLCNQQIPHPHFLIFCRRRDPSFDFYCGACGLPFEKKGDRAFIYVCLECRLLLHNSCADWPQEITNHPFHPHHPLAIHQKLKFSCSACRSSRNTLSFGCSQNCDFQLDILCATLISKAATSTTKYHKHPLIDCFLDQQVNKFHNPCPACNQPFKDSLSFCSDCRVLAHKSCIELPFRITHPFHPHQLQLSSWRIKSKCHACLESQHGLSYECNLFHCGYRSCLRCAFMGYSVTKDCSSHLIYSNHLLYSFDFQPLGSKFDCDRCGHQIFTPFFRCIQCNFNLHFHCLSRLPPAATHKYHRHTLTLTYLPIKDHPDEDENAELYCDSCEERRDLLHPSYYCAECHYVAHVHCVRMQVFQYIVQEPTTKELYKSFKAMTNFLKSSTLTKYLPIQHHLHPQHLLTLSVSTDFGQNEKFRCSICLSICHNLAYVCDICMFYLDLECASISMPSMTKSKPQQLELDFFSHLPLELELYCSICCRKISTPFVYCQECNLALHDKCIIKSGHTVKHKCHRDPLSFIVPDKNDNVDDDKYMCIRCSKKGNLRNPIYICTECSYSVHIGCILPSEIACLVQKLTLTERLGNVKVEQDVSSYSWLSQFNVTLSSTHQTANKLKEISDTNSTDAESDVGNQEINSVQLAKVDKKIAKLVAELKELDEIRAKLLAELEELEENRAQLIASSPKGTNISRT